MSNCIITSNELYHHGVLGMKWGVRRYQSYAEKPRKSGKGGKLIGEARKKKQARKPSHSELLKSTDAKLLYEHRSELSDDELRNRLNRLNMEKQLKSFTKKEKSITMQKAQDLIKTVDTAVKLKALFTKGPLKIVEKGALIVSSAINDILDKKDETKRVEYW